MFLLNVIGRTPGSREGKGGNMDIVYWSKYLLMALLGTLLVLLSMHEIVNKLHIAVKPKEWLRSAILYAGLFILVYSVYCLIIDAMVYQ